MYSRKILQNKKQSILLNVTAFLILNAVIAVISCNRKFDAPPVYLPPGITANTSIAALKAMHTAGNADSIQNDAIIGGIVIANDSSGNFYKQMIIQDTTGGIAINIDDNNLYTSFPIGRKVYVKMNGLYMNDDGGLMYIGTSPDAGGNLTGIPSRLKEKYLIKGELNVPVAPLDVTVQDLKNNSDRYAYSLVRLSNFEVKAGDTAKTYANATAKTDASITLKNCAGDTIVLRTSGYSSFAGVSVPNGNGALTAVYVYYKSAYTGRITPQVMIRDTSDVQFTGVRCDGSSGQSQTGNGELISIKALRAMYNGSDKKLGAYKISGVVISDAANKNIAAGSVALQNADRGIAVYFGSAVTYNIGDSIVLDITGDSLINYRGSLEIKTTYGAVRPTPAATGINIVPKEMNIGDLKSQLADIEYTLVKVKSVATSGNAIYSGSQTLADATGNITLYTNPSAVFANSTIPSGSNYWTGFGSFYNSTPQFQIRSTDDVTSEGPSVVEGNPDLMISEYVEGSSNNKYLEIYNAGSINADLSKYVVKLYINGHDAAHGADKRARLDSVSGTASLAPGALLVFSTATASLVLPQGIVAHAATFCSFNGDDALTLEKDGNVIDVFGTVGVDPGTSWTIAGNNKAAVDKAVRRKADVLHGNTNWTSSSANEWEVVAVIDDVSGLGKR